MSAAGKFWLTLLLSLPLAASARAQAAQPESAGVLHQVEGRVQHRAGGVRNVRVRLLRLPEMRPVAETYSRPEGQFTFNHVREGDYLVETFETEVYEAASANVLVRPVPRGRPQVFTVFVELSLKTPPEQPRPGEVMADVDLDVPKEALKHFREGMQRLDKGDSEGAVKELRAAVEKHPTYYAARLELGRELRRRKQGEEAAEVLRPLAQIAPRRAAPRLELGITLLSLGRRDESIGELRAALSREEGNWMTHLYLGWALLETPESDAAEEHFRRALKLDEVKAARAHLALARLADARGDRRRAVEHLDAYLAIAPDASDAEAARRLAEKLRSPD
jgi:tetratricopeptide (TPR) repeat protein